MQYEPIHDTTNLAAGRDLSKPAELAAELAELVGGLEQQALSARSGTALAGAPYPEHFFARCARAMRAAAAAVAPVPAAAPPAPAAGKRPVTAG